jgi:hypothetical protein
MHGDQFDQEVCFGPMHAWLGDKACNDGRLELVYWTTIQAQLLEAPFRSRIASQIPRKAA